jgi:hypothetical protein
MFTLCGKAVSAVVMGNEGERKRERETRHENDAGQTEIME